MESSPVVWIQTNCQTSNKREIYVKELMKHIDVDSYGPCLHNKDFPVWMNDTRHALGWGKRKLEIISQYKVRN